MTIAPALAPVAVISDGYSQTTIWLRRQCRRPTDSHQQPSVHGDWRDAAGVFRRRSGRRTAGVCADARRRSSLDGTDARMFVDPNYYWAGIMGRLRPGVSLAQAEAALATPFAQWVAPTAANDRERTNLPVLKIAEGARRPRQPAAKIREADLPAAGHRRPDPGDRVREHRQPAARAGHGAPTRDRGAAQHRRRTLPADPPAVD